MAIEHAIGRRFWLGYGYAIFWVRQSGSLQEVLAAGWNALSAQNGYLDMGLDLGIVGLALFFCTLASAIRRGAHALHSNFLRTAKWPLLFLIFFAVQNIHESDLIRLGTFMWIPFVATSVSLALMEAKAKLAAREMVSIRRGVERIKFQQSRARSSRLRILSQSISS